MIKSNQIELQKGEIDIQERNQSTPFRCGRCYIQAWNWDYCYKVEFNCREIIIIKSNYILKGDYYDLIKFNKIGEGGN